jgi:hypothetical protein
MTSTRAPRSQVRRASLEMRSFFETLAANARLQLQQHSQALAKFDSINARAHLLSREPSVSSAASAVGSKANDAAFNSNQLQVAHDAARVHHPRRVTRHVQVQHIMAEQDAGLTQLSHSVRLLGDMGKDISVELGQQQRIIDEFDTELNVVTGRFSQAQAKIMQVAMMMWSTRQLRRVL